MAAITANNCNLNCIDANKSIDELTLKELQAFSPVFGEDIYDAISLETCVEKRLTIGAPGTDAMNEVIRLGRSWLGEQRGAAQA